MLNIETNCGYEMTWRVGEKFPELPSETSLPVRDHNVTEIRANGPELRKIMQLIPALRKFPFTPEGAKPELRTWKGTEAVLMYAALYYALKEE